MYTLLDCTLRDGGYYNSWDFELAMINQYLKAVTSLPADVVELGFRSVHSGGGKFMGGCAYCTDEYIKSLSLPNNNLRLAVMVNGADLLNYPDGVKAGVDRLFGTANDSPLEIVRIASHVHKVQDTLPAITRLNELGYKTTVQLMQISGLSTEKIKHLARICSECPLDVLYFADSLGSMVPEDVDQTIEALRSHWQGELGFHAHNNMERALSNCIRAMELGVTWIDGTVLGMGRGPGNACTEYLAVEFETRLGRKMNLTPLLDLIEKYFRPMHQQFGWGPNPYYYLAGKYGVHPTYVQTMLADNRYDSDEILGVLEEISKMGGKHYTPDSLELARQFYTEPPRGSWNPEELIKEKTVLILGSGPKIHRYSKAIQGYVQQNSPVVIALNKQSPIDQELISARAACRPLRLLADYDDHINFPQPLISPISMLPRDIAEMFARKKTLDFGITVKENEFEVYDNYCVLPYSLVFAYVLAICIKGKASKILLAGFDGFQSGDPRAIEMENIFSLYFMHPEAVELIAVTPTTYNIKQGSIYDPDI